MYNAGKKLCWEISVLNDFWYVWIVFVLLVCVKPFMCLNFEAYFRMLAFFHDSWPLCIMQICSEISVLNYFWYVWIVSVLLVCINPLMGLNFEAYFRMLALFFIFFSWQLTSVYNAEKCQFWMVFDTCGLFLFYWSVLICFMCLNFEAYFRTLASSFFLTADLCV